MRRRVHPAGSIYFFFFFFWFLGRICCAGEMCDAHGRPEALGGVQNKHRGWAQDLKKCMVAASQQDFAGGLRGSLRRRRATQPGSSRRQTGSSSSSSRQAGR